MYLFLNKVSPGSAKLLTVEGFVDSYLNIHADLNRKRGAKRYRPVTHRQAYEETEKLFVEVFGKRRYASFESFRQVRNRYLKKTGKNHGGG